MADVARSIKAKKYRQHLSQSNNLSAEEINELVNFECWTKPSKVSAQARYHVLKFKFKDPNSAEELWSEVEPLARTAELGCEQAVRLICLNFHKRGALVEIYFKNTVYRPNQTGTGIRLSAYQR